MKKLLIPLLMLMSSCNPAFATQIVFPTVYGPTSQVTNVTLNGDNSAVSNVVNGNLDNSNANTIAGYRFYQTVSSLPAAGNTGQVYFLTSDDSLNFDTGSTFIKTIGISGIPAQGNVVIYGASGLVYAATGTANSILTSQGAGSNPIFSSNASLGTLVTSGNVGIGSSSPGQALDVQGTVRATGFSGPTISSVLSYGSSTSSSTSVPGSNLKIAFGNSTSTSITITNLPFTSSSTYTILMYPNTGTNSNCTYSNNSGSSASISCTAGAYGWQAIGY